MDQGTAIVLASSLGGSVWKDMRWI